MKSIDQVTFGASGTASASGLSRFNRFRGLNRSASNADSRSHWTGSCACAVAHPARRRVDWPNALNMGAGSR